MRKSPKPYSQHSHRKSCLYDSNTASHCSVPVMLLVTLKHRWPSYGSSFSHNSRPVSHFSSWTRYRCSSFAPTRSWVNAQQQLFSWNSCAYYSRTLRRCPGHSWATWALNCNVLTTSGYCHHHSTGMRQIYGIHRSPMNYDSGIQGCWFYRCCPWIQAWRKSQSDYCLSMPFDSNLTLLNLLSKNNY